MATTTAATTTSGLDGTALPALCTEVPGPVSRAHVDRLARHECPAITARRARRAALLGAADDDPMVWAEAVGANVRDVDGNVHVDLTSGFAVALVGHRHPRVVAAATAQAQALVHAMGDAWPDVSRIELLERLAALAPGELEVSILGLSGSDAMDAAVKTAVLATGRPGVITFDGSYHGLSLGVLGLQGYRDEWIEPFRAITHAHVRRLPWACDMAALAGALGHGDVGLVLCEPIQGRGGIRVPPSGWLAGVAAMARAHGALFCLDELQTGLGRTGAWFGCQHEGVVPDLLCVGKALGGGFPISACMGTAEVMNHWGASRGEALHTQTFLGHPIGCRAALAVLSIIEEEDLPGHAAQEGAWLAELLTSRGYGVRGRGLMLGIELGDDSLGVARALMRRGFLVLPAGQRADVLALTPPACLTRAQALAFVDALDQVVPRP